MVSGSISLPSPGFFSPFPHGTSALSVAISYLALDRGRPSFRQGFSGLALLRTPPHEEYDSLTYGALTRSGQPFHAVWLLCIFVTSRALAHCSRRYLQHPTYNGVHLTYVWVWALPCSLAATYGISIDFFSSGYLDGSVPRVSRLQTY